MRRIYLLALVLLLGVSMNAQFNYSPSALGRQTHRGEPTTSVQFSEDRVTIWESDFSDCNEWDTYNAFDEGYTDYITGINFQCGEGLMPTGPAPIDPLASTTAENGFMMVDSDLFGGETGGSWIENCWFQTVQSIDCSLYDHVSLKFETFYYMWDNGSSDGNEYCLVELSTDGVTWPDLETYEVDEADPGMRYELWPTMSTQDPVANPTLKIFDITEGAANEGTLYLRFRWKGTWGYAWMVDDVELFETPEIDLTLLKTYNGDIINDYEYYAIPETQIGDLVFGATTANWGYTDQPGAEVNFEIMPGGLTFGANASINASTVDTVWTEPISVPQDIDVYTVTATVPADDFPEGNTLVKTYEITDDVYGHNTDADLVQRGFDQDDEVGIGTTYYMNNDDMVGGVNVMFGSNTDADQEVTALIWLIGADIQDLGDEPVGSSQPFTITSDMINTGEYVTIPFDGAVAVDAGLGYVVEIRKEESSDRLYVLANVLDEDFATVNYGPFGADNAINWFVSWNWTPSVRLNMDESVAIGKVAANGGIELFQNSPNPATATTNITYNLENASKVTLTIRDITGRVVSVLDQGSMPSGQHRIELSVVEMASGIYSYTLNAGAINLTKEMIVR
ncbi:MAG: T9SS type A sorting domain-containing protein [Flavobacteriales bacterium]|nr:T9SS type A sorting domain-containing protein [Flavobacteriales bacterium]